MNKICSLCDHVTSDINCPDCFEWDAWTFPKCLYGVVEYYSYQLMDEVEIHAIYTTRSEAQKHIDYLNSLGRHNRTYEVGDLPIKSKFEEGVIYD